jgi:hypothetical protein
VSTVAPRWARTEHDGYRATSRIRDVWECRAVLTCGRRATTGRDGGLTAAASALAAPFGLTGTAELVLAGERRRAVASSPDGPQCGSGCEGDRGRAARRLRGAVHRDVPRRRGDPRRRLGVLHRCGRARDGRRDGADRQHLRRALVGVRVRRARLAGPVRALRADSAGIGDAQRGRSARRRAGGRCVGERAQRRPPARRHRLAVR